MAADPLFTKVKMASLLIFARLSKVLPDFRFPEFQKITSPATFEVIKRWSTFQGSPIYTDPSKYSDFEISNDPEEWKYVERVLPYKVVPKPTATDQTISGWRPQNEKRNWNLPYFVPRSKNYMQPVYLQRSKRGMRRLTFIRKIQGDIWKFEADLKTYVERVKRKKLATRINELAGVVILHGDHVSAAKAWLNKKGL